MDLSRDILFNGFLLNDEDVRANVTAGDTVGSGISGCVIDSCDPSDVDVIQFMEKRSLQDGMDAGDVYLGARRMRMAGTLYGETRAILFDMLADLRAALSPTLSFRVEPADKGFQPLYFSVPTNRVDDYPAGAIDLRVLAQPRGFRQLFDRDQQGGTDSNALAIPWQATFIMRDPTIQSDVPVETELAATTVVTGATIEADDNLVTKAAHGLAANDRIYFVTLTGGTGLTAGTNYYVISSGLTSSTFKVSTTQGGAEVNITVDYSAASYVKIAAITGNITNRGNYHVPLNMLIPVTSRGGLITVAIGDANFTITVPASSGDRIIRYKGADKIVTAEEDGEEELAMSMLSFQNGTTHPLIPGGESPYSVSFTSGLVVEAGAMFWFWEAYA